MAYHPYHFVGEVLLHPVYILTCYIHESPGLKLKWERDLFPSLKACQSGLSGSGASTENWRSVVRVPAMTQIFLSKSIITKLPTFTL